MYQDGNEGGKDILFYVNIGLPSHKQTRKECRVRFIMLNELWRKVFV